MIGFVAAWFSGADVGSRPTVSGTADVGPPGVGSSSRGMEITAYQTGRSRMEAAAEMFHSDSWGCSWLTGGVSISHAVVDDITGDPAGFVHLSALSAGLVGEGDVAAFAGGVEVVHDDGRRAVGDALLTAAGSYELRGTPARVWSERGQLFADSFVFDESSGEVSGSGGVSANVGDGAGIFSNGDAETWIQAERFRTAGDAITFIGKGRVRAWSGSDLLESDRLTVDGDDVEAVGSVRLSLRGEISAEIAADRLERQGQRMVFIGDVVGTDDLGRHAECGAMLVELDDDNQPANLECWDGAKIQAPPEDFEVTRAEAARYSRAAGIAEARGRPATVKRDDGSMSAPVIVYDIATQGLRAGEESEGEGDEQESSASGRY